MRHKAPQQSDKQGGEHNVLNTQGRAVNKTQVELKRVRQATGTGAGKEPRKCQAKPDE